MSAPWWPPSSPQDNGGIGSALNALAMFARALLVLCATVMAVEAGVIAWGLWLR